MKTCWKLAWLVALTVFAAGEANAQAENYPNRPVRIISDSAPGSAVDISLRIVADGLGRHWGQQVIVLNQPGAGGAISARVASDATPDGYTLFAPALSVFLTLPGKAPNLPVVIPRDFEPIGFTAEQPMSIGAGSQLGISTLPELIDLAKKKPGELSYSVSGIGRLTHLTGELLQLRAGIKLQTVPYSAGGTAQALSDIIGGRISLAVEGYTGLSSAFAAGTLKPLAVASAERLAEAPNVPTVSETIPGFIATGWQAVVAPRGTPQPLIEKVSADLRKVLTTPDTRDKLAARGSYARPMSPAEITAFVKAQQELWQPALERIAEQTK
jgi:tripartite-type tricarboxylate transporter receptor subunit TctC